MTQKMHLLSAAAFALLQLPTLTSAQNDTIGENCPPSLEPIVNGEFNSSGSLAFQFEDQDEWHLSLVLRDIRRGERSYPATEQLLTAFLSVPESLIGSEQGEKTRVCSYWMNGRNATVKESNSTLSCGGVLSDKCQQVLHDIDSVSIHDDDCPSLDSKEVREACDDIVWLSTSTPLNFSNPRCALEGLPGIDMPSDYRTLTILGAGLGQPYENDSTFELYDLRVQQPVPILINALVPYMPGSDVRSDVRKIEQQVFCLAPDNVRGNSRIPAEGSLPGSAPGMDPRKTSIFAAVVMSCALAALLV